MPKEAKETKEGTGQPACMICGADGVPRPTTDYAGEVDGKKVRVAIGYQLEGVGGGIVPVVCDGCDVVLKAIPGRK